MLVTVTPNPSLDLLFQAEALVWDDANRLDPPRIRPGGQGVNVSRAARALGMETVAVVPLGGIIGSQIRAMLEAERTPVRVVDVRSGTRIFVGVREEGTERNLLLNPRGRELSVGEQDALAEAVLDCLTGARWLACCGSLPSRLPDDFYARLGAEARRTRRRFVPDCDGAALQLAAASGCDLLVPNAHEAGRLLKRPVPSVESAGAAARDLLDFGPAWASVTLGSQGAVCATADGVWHAEAPLVVEGSAVGAGDAFLAAVIGALDEGAEAPHVLRRGVAAGTAALLGEGLELIRAEDVDRLADAVSVRPLDV